jgi:hypothetical protein
VRSTNTSHSHTIALCGPPAFIEASGTRLASLDRLEPTLVVQAVPGEFEDGYVGLQESRVNLLFGSGVGWWARGSHAEGTNSAI